MMKVHIELQRVQTWLFAVPRLRAMVGANTLIGEVLRCRLPELARQQSALRLAKEADGYPSAAADDPLKDHDDPAADARDGILSRDGGHFEACFESGAEAFARAAARLLRRELPGIRFRIAVDGKPQPTPGVDLSRELPVLAPCEWTGRGLGSTHIEQGSERPWVSRDVARRHDAAKRAESGNAQDLASLLIARTCLKGLERPREFKDFAGTGYLALIHADGNGVGGARPPEPDRAAAFFHRNRVLLRRALQAAIDTCSETDACREGESSAPLIPLMLGGDDLLVLSRAEPALGFVATLCEELDRLQRDDTDGFRLTLGVGVVFARPTIPIHRLHDVAERLAASAKRRFRGFPETEPRSVVDWAVYTTTWVDDPEEVRRRDWLCGKRILSRRPVDVLGDGLDSLQGLLEGAKTIQDAPRSQLRYLIDQLPRGQALSELAFAELSPDARKGLKDAGVDGVDKVWQTLDGGWRVTPVLDLVEVSEIRRLGRAGTRTEPATAGKDGKEAAHAEA